VLAVGIALTASACWGVADFMAGLLSRRMSALLILLGQQLVGAVIVAIVVAGTLEDPPPTETILVSLAAGVAGAVALGCFYRALAIGTMSVVAPISTSGAVLPVAVGLLTGDRPSAVQAIGLAVTMVGVLLASRELAEGEAAGRASRRSILLALVAAVGFGMFFTLSDSAADDSILWLLLLSRGISVVLLTFAVVAVAGRSRPERPARRDLGTIALIGVLDMGATGLYALANTEGLLSVVAVVGSLYPVTTVLLARFVLHERLRPTQAAGVLLAFLGVAAVAGG
jgi:drug/metabolite transporter (DMT)-like permease